MTNDAPKQTEGNGRDALGRFIPGHPGGPGRPPKMLDFRKLVLDAAAEHDVDVHARVWKVAQAMFDAAEAGDVAAAKLILDRMCGLLRQEIDINPDNPPVLVVPGKRVEPGPESRN